MLGNEININKNTYRFLTHFPVTVSRLSLTGKIDRDEMNPSDERNYRQCLTEAKKDSTSCAAGSCCRQCILLWCFYEMSEALRHWEHKENTITMIGGNEQLSRLVRKIRQKQKNCHFVYCQLNFLLFYQLFGTENDNATCTRLSIAERIATLPPVYSTRIYLV